MNAQPPTMACNYAKISPIAIEFEMCAKSSAKKGPNAV